MNLEILSFKEALNYVPNKKSYGIRIDGPFDRYNLFNPLKKSDNWIKVNSYCFDDLWSKDWKEYDWIDVDNFYFTGAFTGTFEEIKKQFPKITRESLIEYYENEGHPWGRFTLFKKDIARKILDDFEEVKNDVENVMIHCVHGENRAPAIGIAMNEIYGWGINGLKEKFPNYRRFVYDILVDTAKKK